MASSRKGLETIPEAEVSRSGESLGRVAPVEKATLRVGARVMRPEISQAHGDLATSSESASLPQPRFEVFTMIRKMPA